MQEHPAPSASEGRLAGTEPRMATDRYSIGYTSAGMALTQYASAACPKKASQALENHNLWQRAQECEIYRGHS